MNVTTLPLYVMAQFICKISFVGTGFSYFVCLFFPNGVQVALQHGCSTQWILPKSKSVYTTLKRVFY